MLVRTVTRALAFNWMPFFATASIVARGPLGEGQSLEHPVGQLFDAEDRRLGRTVEHVDADLVPR